MTQAVIVEAYKSGWSLRKIGRAMDCSHEHVRRQLLREGVALRNGWSGCYRKSTALTEELRDDLERWPEGVTLGELAEWFGENRAAVLAAVQALLAGDEVAITRVDR